MTEQNDNPERYDGDHCMHVIESWPLKQSNGNASGAMFCIGSILKYLWRLERKGEPLEPEIALYATDLGECIKSVVPETYAVWSEIQSELDPVIVEAMARVKMRLKA